MSKDLKRKRAVVTTESKKKAKQVQKRKSKTSAAVTVRGDALKWREATLPDRLDDAEGFFGLEEIEDVEVVKSDSGGVFFKARKSDIDEWEVHNDNEGEWTGFDEPTEDHSVQMVNEELTNSEGISEANRKAHLDQDGHSKQTKSQAANGEILDAGLDFNVLDENSEQRDTDVTAWQDLEISNMMLSAISNLGFSYPTPIQKASIPSIIAGYDVIGKAVTGSGKTLAFGIPVVERWLKRRFNKVSNVQNDLLALILAPTRELAHQLTTHLRALCASLADAPRIISVTGGLSVLKQRRQLENADIVVATPGRLWEVINNSTGLIDRLRRIDFLVLDEADRLLSEGHFKEVEDTINILEKDTFDDDAAESTDKGDASKKARQILVFSATFHKDLQRKLTAKHKFVGSGAGDLLDNKQSMSYLINKLPFQTKRKPTFVDANPDSQMAENLTETILECGSQQKDLYLYTYLLQERQLQTKLLVSNSKSEIEQVSRILVFTNSISTVKRLVPLLQSLNLPSTTILPLHSNMIQKARLRSLERFSEASTANKSHTYVLVSTDVAARGLDIKEISTVIHYHVPRAADTYVHRSGRTARKQNAGKSILLCSPDEIAGVTRLIAKIHVEGRREIKDVGKVIDRMYISPELIRQVEKRVSLAQKITDSTQSTEKVKSEDNWLQKAAEDLGVEYDSEEFEEAGKRGRRGRGGGRDRKQKKVAEAEDRAQKLAEWKTLLKDESKRKIDFGDGTGRNAKYLAGGAIDMEQLLAERGHL